MSNSKADENDPHDPRKESSSLSEESLRELRRNVVHDTGYKKPPKHTQFKKGQSGNPKGRPRKDDFGPGADRSASRLLLQEADRSITLTDASGSTESTGIQAVARKQYLTAMKGNPLAQKHVIERYDLAERDRRRSIAEENEIWRYYCDRTRKEIADAKAKGETLPDPLPHPDDIVLDLDKGVRFIGPLVQEQVDDIEDACRTRDLLILQDQLDHRLTKTDDVQDPLDGPGAALLHACALNGWVPPRWRLSEGAMCSAMMRARNLTKRQLLKTVYRGWQSLGRPVPRGETFGSVRDGRLALKVSYKILRSICDGDFENSTTEEIAEVLMDMFEELGVRVNRDGAVA